MSVAAPQTRAVNGVPDWAVNVPVAVQPPNTADNSPPLSSHRRLAPNGSSSDEVGRELLAAIEVGQRPFGAGVVRVLLDDGARRAERGRVVHRLAQRVGGDTGDAVREPAGELEVAEVENRVPPEASQVNGCTSGIDSVPPGPLFGALSRSRSSALHARVADEDVPALGEIAADARIPRLDEAEPIRPCPRPSCSSSTPTWASSAFSMSSVGSRPADDRLRDGRRRLRGQTARDVGVRAGVVGDAVAAAHDRAPDGPVGEPDARTDVVRVRVDQARRGTHP